jgi:hypothetical protein
MSYARNWAKRDARPRGAWKGNYTTRKATEAEAIATGYTAAHKCVRLIVDSRDPLRFCHESGAEWCVPTGLISDGGSIPSWAQMSPAKWMQLKPFGKKETAFFLHDAGYHDASLWMRENAKAKWQCVRVTRAIVDLLLYQGLTACGASNAECSAIYAAVRTPFGAKSWARCQRLIKKGKENGQ